MALNVGEGICRQSNTSHGYMPVSAFRFDDAVHSTALHCTSDLYHAAHNSYNYPVPGINTAATTRLSCMPTLHEHLPHATLANSPATLRHRPRLCLCVDTLARLGSIDTTVDNIASLGMEIPTTRTRPPIALQLPSVLKHFNTDYKTSDSQQASSSLRCFTMPVDPQFAVHLTCVHC
jgi:hypothetical protein